MCNCDRLPPAPVTAATAHTTTGMLVSSCSTEKDKSATASAVNTHLHDPLLCLKQRPGSSHTPRVLAAVRVAWEQTRNTITRRQGRVSGTVFVPHCGGKEHKPHAPNPYHCQSSLQAIATHTDRLGSVTQCVSGLTVAARHRNPTPLRSNSFGQGQLRPLSLCPETHLFICSSSLHELGNLPKKRP